MELVKEIIQDLDIPSSVPTVMMKPIEVWQPSFVGCVKINAEGLVDVAT